MIKLNVKNPDALFQKAEALYDLGRYEMALVFFHRATKVRPDNAQYLNGVEKSQDAINGKLICITSKLIWQLSAQVAIWTQIANLIHIFHPN